MERIIAIWVILDPDVDVLIELVVPHGEAS